MNTLFTRARLLAVLLLSAFAATTFAQGLNPEAVAFAKTYQDAYNKGDRPKLMTLFADNVGWVNPDGSVRPNTKADVDADFVRDFGETAGSYMDFAVVSTEAQSDGKVKIGTTVNGYVRFSADNQGQTQPHVRHLRDADRQRRRAVEGFAGEMGDERGGA